MPETKIPPINIPETKIPPFPEVKIPEVNVPETKFPPFPPFPEIKVPKAEVTVKIPPIKVPTPKITVNVPPIKVPKIEIPDHIVNLPSSLIIDNKRTNPVPVILTDNENRTYSIAQIISGGGGGGGLIKGQDANGALHPIEVDENGNLRVDLVSGVVISTYTVRSSSSTTAAVSVGADTSTNIVPTNLDRKSVIFVHASSSNLYLATGTAVSSSCFPIVANQIFGFDDYTGPVNAIAEEQAGTISVRYIEVV